MPQTKIGIDATRAAQLAEIAQQDGTTVAGLIDGFVRQEWRRRQNAHLPGFAIRADKGEVALGADDALPVRLTAANAGAVAAAMQEVLGGAAREVVEACEGGRDVLIFRRQGTGFTLKIASYSRPLTASVAEDLVGLLADAAEDASQP